MPEGYLSDVLKGPLILPIRQHRELDKRNFRKRVLAMSLLVETDEVEQDVAHRTARLYRFDEKKYRHLTKAGFHFEL